MINLIGWSVFVIAMLIYFLDLSMESAARTELAEISHEREVERVADECEMVGLPLDIAEPLMVIKVIRLNEAWRRFGYAMCPHPLARLLLPEGNPAR